MHRYDSSLLVLFTVDTLRARSDVGGAENNNWDGKLVRDEC